jgi:hypothetical protein
VIPWDEYRDGLGFMSGKPNPTEPESNAVLFSALERALRLRLGTWTEGEQDRLERAIGAAGPVEGGKLSRPSPWRQDPESPDDHIGLGACGVPQATRAVLDYLAGNPWYLGFFSIRFSAIFAHLQWASGKTPALWRRVYWAGSFAVSGTATDQDAWVQGLLLLDTAPASWLKVVASGVYWYRLKAAWPGGLAGVWAAYNGSEHPVAQACRELGI